MLKSITERSLSELILELRRRGLDMKDLEGGGVHSDPSGHIYAIYDDGEPNIVDSTMGEAGVSGYVFDTPVSQASVTIGAIRSDGSTSVTISNSVTGSATLSTYVVPRTISIADSGGNAATLSDDGLGVIRETATYTPRGTINYHTGALSVTYPPGKAPTGTVTSTYKYSEYPASTDFPPKCKITRVEIETTSNDSVEVSLFDKAFASTDSLTAVQSNPCLPAEFLDVSPDDLQSIPSPNTNGITSQYGFASNDEFPSLILETDPDKQGKRWVNILSSNTSTKVKSILVYWQKL